MTEEPFPPDPDPDSVARRAEELVQDSLAKLRRNADSEVFRAVNEIKRTLSSIQLPRIEPFPLPPSLLGAIREAASLSRLFERIEELSHSHGVAHERLWSIGWTISMKMPILCIYDSAALVEERPIRSHRMLAAWYTTNLKEIETALVSLHPARANILSSAFAAHRRGEYFLSVPVLLAQSDGMSHDVLRAGLYEKRGADVATAVRNSTLGNYMKRIGATLEKEGPIHAHESALDPATDPLNRHRVIHGRTMSYGTRLKSLQAIALANLVGVDLTKAIREADAELARWRTSTEGLILERSRFEGGNPASRPIAGTVVNRSDVVYSQLEVRIELIGRNGIVVGRTTIVLPGLGAKASHSFRKVFDASTARHCRVAAVVGT